MVALHPYPRGFVIFRRDSSPALPESWSTVSLGDSEWDFAHDHLESPELVTVGAGERWVLVHGLCLYAGHDERDMTPAHRLAEAAASGDEAFLDVLDILGGRYIVLLGDAHEFSLYQDATGMRSVYFSSETRIVSSHAHVIHQISAHPRRTAQQGARSFIRSWDRTPFVGIDALLPNHALTIPHMSVSRFFPRDQNSYVGWSVPQRVTEYREIWDRQWRALTSERPELLFSITGGQDSRTTLALLGECASTLKSFTYTADGDSSHAQSLTRDKLVVEQLSQLVKLDHRFIRREQDPRPKPHDYSSLLAVNSLRGHGSWLIPHYATMVDGDRAVHIRGNVYGLYKSHWREKFRDGSSDEVTAWMTDQMNRACSTEADDGNERYVHDGLRRWQYDQPTHGYDVSDLLYWEIRLGRWASEIYNETDAVFTSLDTTNLRELLKLALSFTELERRAGLFQNELINDAHPVLNFPGKNDVHNLYEKTRALSLSNDGLLAAHLKQHEHHQAMQKFASITLEDGTDQEIAFEASVMLIPSEYFAPGCLVTRKFLPTASTGELTFSVNNGYANASGLDTWFVDVMVDRDLVYRWDGAARHRSVNVLVSGLTPGSEVAVRLVPARPQVDKRSWERASLTRISNAVFRNTPQGPPVRVLADIDNALTSVRHPHGPLTRELSS